MRRKRSPVLVVLAAVAACLSGCHGNGSSPLAQGANGGSGGVAVVPHNNKAVIYDEFGAFGSTLLAEDHATIDHIHAALVAEGYDVTVISDPFEGNAGPNDNGGATVENFVKIAQYASVVVIDTHGQDYSGKKQSCTKVKGVFVEPNFPTEAPPPASGPIPPAPPITSTDPCDIAGQRAMLSLQWFPTTADETAEELRLDSLGFSPSWFDGGWADTFRPVTVQDRYYGRYKGPYSDGSYIQVRPTLALNSAGIAHFFSHAKLDFVDDMSCHSMAMAPAFNATSFVGHDNIACGGFESHDEPLFWDRLTGHYGVQYRTTTAAMAAGGFADPEFEISGGSKPVVLSPATESVSPADGSTVAGASTDVTVKFDARSRRPAAQELVSVSGCGAQVSDGGGWGDDDSTLNFTVKTDPNTTDNQLTLTINGSEALAPGDGNNDRLSGNQQPSPGNGEEPNQTAYIWHLACNGTPRPPSPPPAQPSSVAPSPSSSDEPVTITYSGSFKSNGTTLMDNPSQVHASVNASGTWTDTWHVHLSDLQPPQSSGPTFIKGVSATTMTVNGTSHQVNTNPSSICDQTETKAGNVSLQLYPVTGASPTAPLVAAVTNPSMTTGGVAGTGGSWTVTGGCDGVMPGVFAAGGIISAGDGLLGNAAYSPSVEIPDQYLSPAELNPAGFRDLSRASHHLMAGIFTLNPASPATNVSFSFSYTIPPDVGVPEQDTHDDETGGITYAATLTITVGS